MTTTHEALREAVEALKPLAANAEGVHPDWCDSRRRASLDNEKPITVGACRKAAAAIHRAEEALIQPSDMRHTQLREAVYLVLEGWNIPDGVRKILETAYYNTSEEHE